MARSSGRWPRHPVVDVPLPLLDAATDTPDVGTTVAYVSVAILTSHLCQLEDGARTSRYPGWQGRSYPPAFLPGGE